MYTQIEVAIIVTALTQTKSTLNANGNFISDKKIKTTKIGYLTQ